LALTSIAILPFGPNPIHLFGRDIYLGIVDLNIGLLALFAITALSVYGVALAGWSSNSKYPLLGGLRSSAQMISYELALTMSVVGVLIGAGSFSLREIIGAQASHLGILGWNVFPQILGFLCFFTAAVAETNRVPFDLPEAESELVAGFHTEYASFKFAMFFIAEYTSMITVSSLCSIMFFGGWLSPFPSAWTFTHYLPSLILIPFGLWVIWDGVRYETVFGRLILPGLGTVITVIGAVLIAFPAVNEFIQGPFWLLSKILTFLFVYVWMRGTLPRFRYDQLMSFGWKLLLPVSLANVVITAAVVVWRGH
jgi:NADH-quinone oxidoreductase subunit H